MWVSSTILAFSQARMPKRCLLRLTCGFLFYNKLLKRIKHANEWKRRGDALNSPIIIILQSIADNIQLYASRETASKNLTAAVFGYCDDRALEEMYKVRNWLHVITFFCYFLVGFYFPARRMKSSARLVFSRPLPIFAYHFSDKKTILFSMAHAARAWIWVYFFLHSIFFYEWMPFTKQVNNKSNKMLEIGSQCTH